MSRLRFTIREDAIAFWVQVSGDSGRIASNEWTRQAETENRNGGRANLGALLRRLDEGSASIDGDAHEILIPHSEIAQMDLSEIRGLGLPDPYPHAIRVRGEGKLVDPSFSFVLTYVAVGGRNLPPVQRTGAIVKIGAKPFTLRDPMFRVVDAISRFSTEGDSPSEILAEIGAILGIDAVGIEKQGYLATTKIVAPEAFTIAPYLNSRGEPDFRPVLVRSARESNPSAREKVSVMRPALTDELDERFSDALRRLAKGQGQFAVGSYVIALSANMRKTLSVVRDVLEDGPEVRTALIKNPQSFLKERLGSEMAESEIEHVFFEPEDYGERVKGVGLWEPPALPWLPGAAMDWTPDFDGVSPEESGIVVEERFIPVTPEQAPRLRAEIRQAMDDGRPVVDHDGFRVPASESVLDALDKLIKAVEESPDSEEPKTENARIVIQIHDNLSLEDFVPEDRTRSGDLRELPSNLDTGLFDYQKKGLQWLQEAWKAGRSGVLLADDMGLGKTLQCLAFLAWVREFGALDRPILIVAPTGLLRSWGAELTKHLSGDRLGRVLEAHGKNLAELRERDAAKGHELKGGLPLLRVDRLRDFDVVLTTYETLRDYQHSIGRIKWGVALFDEVQKVKNPRSLMTRAAKGQSSDFFIAITGTPVENRMSDLWTIVDTVAPGKLGSLQKFEKSFQAESDEETHKRLQGLHQFLTEGAPPALMLRRMKEQELDGLPSISFETRRREMPTVQLEAYQGILQGKGRATNRLEALQQIRRVSTHPLVWNGQPDDEFIGASARLGELFVILDDVQSRDEKVLVFSESRLMQSALMEIIQRRYGLRQRPFVVNGKVPGRKRTEIVDSFQKGEGFGVLLLSPKAGGVGLTITAANHVVHLERWWNPAVEDQATDRAYRIGQLKPVTVYYPLAVSQKLDHPTYDELLDRLLSEKRKLSRSVLLPPQIAEHDLEGLHGQVFAD